jgi:hypothetical protein
MAEEKGKLSEKELINKLHVNLAIKENDPSYSTIFKETCNLLIDYLQRRRRKSKRKKHQTPQQRFLEKMDVLLFVASKYDNRFWMTFAVKHGGHDAFYYHRYQLIDGVLIDSHENCNTEEEKSLCENAVLNVYSIEEARDAAQQARLNLFLLNTRITYHCYDSDDDEQ